MQDRKTKLITHACRCMYKISTPEDRAHVRKRLPIVMTHLEMKLPIQWSTSVIHIFTFHAVSILEMAGPFSSSNMLDIESIKSMWHVPPPFNFVGYFMP